MIYKLYHQSDGVLGGQQGDRAGRVVGGMDGWIFQRGCFLVLVVGGRLVGIERERESGKLEFGYLHHSG